MIWGDCGRLTRGGIRLSVATVLTLVTACANTGASATGQARVTTPAPDLSAACVPDKTWVVPGGGATATPTVIKYIAERRIVLLGEYHDDVMHHTWQQSTIASLAALREKVVVGLEMLPRSAQPVVDQWLAGALTEAQFIKQSGWLDYWKFDPNLYLPILRYARLAGIPVYGLNVERSLVEAVREQGWEGVSADVRGGITDPAPPSADYLDLLASSFSMHGPAAAGHGAGAESPDLAAIKADPKFKRFVEGQQLWDRGMAQTLNDVAAKYPGSVIVGLMGSGHLMDRHGVPHQLAALGITDVAVVLPWDAEFDCQMLTKDFADAVFGIRSLPPVAATGGPKLGVQITPADGSVKVEKVISGSVAEAAGVRDGDLLVTLAGRRACGVDDVVATVREILPGAWLPLTVARGATQIELIAKFPFTPDAPASCSPDSPGAAP